MMKIFDHGYAVVIGVDANRMEQLALPTVAKDAQAVYDVLVHPERCAYKPDNVKLLKGAESTRRNILEALYWLQEKVEADPQATVVVYYSGHGMRVKESDEYYLIPYDIRGRGCVRADALKAKEFAAEISKVEAERLLVMLDCCHAGGMGVKDMEAGEKEPRLVPAAFPIDVPEIEDILEYTRDPGSKEASDLLNGKGRAVLNSSTADQPSYVRRDKKMSVFTYHLIEALTGHAPHPDDATVVYVTDVMSWVTHEVKKTAADYSVDQMPEMRTTGVFPVAQLIGGRGVAKDLDEAAPDPLEPLPQSGASGSFYQQGQNVSGKQVNIHIEPPQEPGLKRGFILGIGVLGLLTFLIVIYYLFVVGIGTFDYTVSVSSADTEVGISGAKVTLELKEPPPRDEFTDANGYAVIPIPNALADSRALLIVQAEGYMLHKQQILIKKDELPRGVRLERGP